MRCYISGDIEGMSGFKGGGDSVRREGRVVTREAKTLLRGLQQAMKLDDQKATANVD